MERSTWPTARTVASRRSPRRQVPETAREGRHGVREKRRVSPDREQQFLYVGNGDDIAIVDRKTLTLIGSIKPAGLRNAGHQIATDSKGNLYLAQTTNGLQKLTFKGMSPAGK